MGGPRFGIQAIATAGTERAQDRRASLRRLVRELAPYRNVLAVAGALILVGAAAQAAGPWLVGRAIDGSIARRDPRGLARQMVLLLVVYLTASLASRGQTARVGESGQRALANLRMRLFDRLIRLPLGFFAKQRVGDLMSRVLNDVDTLNQLLSGGLTQLLGSVFSLVGIVVAMFLIDVRLALVSFTILPVMVGTTIVLARRARRAYRVTRETVGDVTAGLEEEIVGVREAQAFSRTRANIERFRQRNQANRTANVQAVGVTSAFAPAIDVLSTIGTALVIGYGGFRVFRGELTFGAVASFLIYVQQFFRPIQLASAVYAQAQSALAGAERIYGILDQAPEQPDPEGARVLGRVAGQIDFVDVSFSYEPERPVLRHVSFTALPGQRVAIVGHTGAGKTTIANLIPRFYEVNDGVVRIDGFDVRDVTRESLRVQIATVLQEPFLFGESVAANIAYARPMSTRAEIESAARAVYAHDFIMLLPNGYDTVLGEAGGALSQGQRQLLSFARAVMADPRILILDEATSNIDTRTELLIQRALRTLLEGRTSIVIAHRLSTIQSADLILVMDQGEIVEQGTHEALLAAGGRYAALHGGQTQSAEALASG